jgi:actin-related protein
MSYYDGVSPLCIMSNSKFITAGFAGDCAPRAVFPSFILIFKK